MLILLLTLQLSSAMNYMVKPLQSSQEEFDLYRLHNPSPTISQYFLQCTSNDELQQLNEKAQFYFLNSSLEKSKAQYKKIITKNFDCPWNKRSRAIIVNAYLRLSQMTTNTTKQNKYLEMSVNFDPTHKVDTEVFPPPMILKLKQYKKSIKTEPISLTKDAIKNFKIYRNGQLVKTKGLNVFLPKGKARFDFISDSYEPHTAKVEAHRIKKSVTLTPLAKGDCFSLQANSSILQGMNYSIYKPASCKSESNLPAKIQMPTTHRKIFNATSKRPVKKKRSWLRRNYLWVGAAVLSSAVLAFQSQSNNRSGAPTAAANTSSGLAPSSNSSGPSNTSTFGPNN